MTKLRLIIVLLLLVSCSREKSEMRNSSSALLKFDAKSYTGFSAQVGITLYDNDLNKDESKKETATVKLYSSFDTTGEEIALIETKENQGVFKGTAEFEEQIQANNAKLAMIKEDTVFVEYIDQANFDEAADTLRDIAMWSLWMQPQILSGNFNSVYHELSFFIHPSNQKMIISSDRYGGQGWFDLFYYDGSNANLSNLSINGQSREDDPWWDVDHNMLYYSYFDGQNSKDIYQVSFDGLTAGVPTEFIVINSDSNDFDLCLSSTTPQKAFFVSTRSGGKGSMDIYMTEVSGSTWIQPVNFPGTGVNTSANEHSPFVSPDGNKLYFSSDRSGGIGGDDIYIYDFQTDQVTNLSKIINSPSDEYSPFLKTINDTTYLFFSSERSNGQGGADIYKAVRVGK